MSRRAHKLADGWPTQAAYLGHPRCGVSNVGRAPSCAPATWQGHNSGASPRRADRAPAGGTRDTMSWVRGPVGGLLGGKDPAGRFRQESEIRIPSQTLVFRSFGFLLQF